jgi:hypothetical protein
VPPMSGPPHSTSGNRVGDQLEQPGRHEDVVAVPVHLDPDAVSLGRRDLAASGLGHRGRDRVALDASIGSTGRPTSSTNSASAASPPSARRRDRHRRAGHHRGPAYGGQGAPTARRRPIPPDQGVEGACRTSPCHDPAQPRLLLGGAPPEQLGVAAARAAWTRSPTARRSARTPRAPRARSASARRPARAATASTASPARCGAGAATRRGRSVTVSISSGSSERDPREERGERRGLRLARTRRPRPRWSGHDVGEQHGLEILLGACPGRRVPFVKKMSDDTDTEESTVHYALLIYTDPHAQDGDTTTSARGRDRRVPRDPGGPAVWRRGHLQPAETASTVRSPTAPRWSPTARSRTPRR